jgi:monovalent cation/hydrogen antiporter
MTAPRWSSRAWRSAPRLVGSIEVRRVSAGCCCCSPTPAGLPAVCGLLVGAAAVEVRRRLTDPLTENVAIQLIPFAAYLLAELAGASGCDRGRRRRSDREPGRPAGRSRPDPAAAYRVLVAVDVPAQRNLVRARRPQAHAAIRGLGAATLRRGAVAIAGTSVAVVAAQFGWLFTSPYMVRLLDRRPQQHGCGTN